MARSFSAPDKNGASASIHLRKNMPLLTYLRYDADLGLAALRDLLEDEANALPVEDLTAMDAPENMKALHRVGTLVGEKDVKSEHFPALFDVAGAQT